MVPLGVHVIPTAAQWLKSSVFLFNAAELIHIEKDRKPSNLYLRQTKDKPTVLFFMLSEYITVLHR